ncbi:hypothetical protein C0993_002877 [Termitomyces sp. T159_Od127]|nr:hypothetical protein C0993_002877 [Termitomyces sp. T159_Od127]
MSAFQFAKQAFGREKPRSSITDWVDILTSSSVQEESYDGIPELVDSINLQAAGPAEASRAVRKKLKHGNAHQQYRALVISKALVENCGAEFTSSFADGHLTDAIRNLSADYNADKKVRKKLMAVLASWQEQFKSDPSMSVLAGLYKQCVREGRSQTYQDVSHLIGTSSGDKRKEQTRERKAEEMGNQFVFEKLVENEELIGTLIETNERTTAALDNYDKIAAGESSESTDILAGDLASTHITTAKEQRNPHDHQDQSVAQKSDFNLHPDLRDLNFGPLGASSNNLPRPLQPSALSDEDEAPRSNSNRGSLSDFSDYSSDEETHVSSVSPRKAGGREYVDVVDGLDDEPYSRMPLTKHLTGDDPFADPSTDEVALGPSKRW